MAVEALISRKEGLMKTLNLGADCLKHKDFLNGHHIYGGILAAEASSNKAVLDDPLELFSIKCCYAYCCIMSNMEILREKGEEILNGLDGTITLPLVPFLKHYNYLKSQKLELAANELDAFKRLLDIGYNFLPNYILNEDILPAVNPLNITTCNSSNKDKECVDFFEIAISCQNELNPVVVVENKTQSLQDGQAVANTGAVKKKKKKPKPKSPTNQNEQQNPSILCEEQQIQTTKPLNQTANKTCTVSTQTQTENCGCKEDVIRAVESNIHKIMTVQTNATVEQLKAKLKEKKVEIQFLKGQLDKSEKKWDAVDTRNKALHSTSFRGQLINIGNKLDAEANKTSKAINRIMDQQNKSTRDLDTANKQIAILKTVLAEQIQNGYQVQKNIYVLLEERCNNKIEYINDIEKCLNMVVNLTIQDCKEYHQLWTKTSTKVAERRTSFETYFKQINDHLRCQDYAAITCNWPEMPRLPFDDQDLIYCSFKRMLQDSNPKFYYNNKYALFDSACEPSTSAHSDTTSDSLYNLEKSLLDHLKSIFTDIDEMDLLDAIYKLRDRYGGSLIKVDRVKLVKDLREMIEIEGKKCCICFESMQDTDIRILSCAHEFHDNCITEWLKRQEVCPVCRNATPGPLTTRTLRDRLRMNFPALFSRASVDDLGF